MAAQGRAIPDEPTVAERIGETALPVRAPRHGVIAHRVVLRRRACGDGPRDERIGVIAEDLDAGGRHAEVLRVVPAIAFRLANKEGCASDGQTNNGAEIPQFLGAESLTVPLRGARRIRT